MAQRDEETAKPNVKSGPKESFASELMVISSVISFYFIISLSMVFLNKMVLSGNFPYPLFLTWAQLVIALALCWIGGKLGEHVSALSMLPKMEFDVKIAKAVAPLTVVYLAMIVFNNLCLQYVQVSFYQVARSLTVLWTALFERVVLGKSVSKLRMCAVVVVFFGFVIGSKGEAEFDWFGLFFGVLASIFVALYGIYVKKVLPAVDSNQWRLLIYNTTIAIVFLFPFVVLTGELSLLDPLKTLDLDFSTWMGILATGVTGWLINIAIFMQIKYTSPLTNAISGTVKAAVQTLLGVLFFHNVITDMNFLGICAVIGGSWWYGQIGYNEMKAERESQAAAAK